MDTTNRARAQERIISFKPISSSSWNFRPRTNMPTNHSVKIPTHAKKPINKLSINFQLNIIKE